MLKENGRLGIVLSNPILSIKKYANVRKWLMSVLRIVAIFNLPPNVFAETGVNTSMLVAYKQKTERLEELKKANYSVFAKDIQNVGYEKRTSKRNVVFNPLYKTDDVTFEFAIDNNGEMIINEEFSSIIKEFRQWCATQEEEIVTFMLVMT